MDTIKIIDKRNTKMVAHAGLMGMEPSNTCAGFIAAGNRTYWGIECDVRVAKDGFVIIHNDTTAEVSPTNLVVSESTVEELQSIVLYDRPFFYGMEHFGLKPNGNETRADLRIPTLEEYIRICKRYGKICVLELKQQMDDCSIAQIAELYRKLDYLDGVVFISFSRENLKKIRAHLPFCSIQLLTTEKQEFTDEFLDEVSALNYDLDVHIFTVTKWGFPPYV